MSVTRQILEAKSVFDEDAADDEIPLTVDQVYTHDNTGTMVYLQYEALDVGPVSVNEMVTYIDHNALEFFDEQSQDHALLKSSAKKFGSNMSKNGNGICHQVHREQFAKPGDFILASDSHTPTLGGLGTLGIGAGGMDVAATMADAPFYLDEPEIVNMFLTGELSEGVTAKDVILSILDELSVKGGAGKIFEFTGPGVKSLSIPERCTICNMTAELGATSGIFPSDEVTREYLRRQNREDDWSEVTPTDDGKYDDRLEVDLSSIDPLVAQPSMPDNLAPIDKVAGTSVDQVLIGSCTNGSFADIAAIEAILRDEQVHPDVDFIIYPGSRKTMETLTNEGIISSLIESGASVSESTCGACIGNGHIPGPDEVSLRAFNRNYSGRSGQHDDSVYVSSPEVATASAIAGEITDPRTVIGDSYVRSPEPQQYPDSDSGMIYNEPNPDYELVKGDNIASVPIKDSVSDDISVPVEIKLGDNITTDHLSPSEADHYRSNIPKLAEYVLTGIDEDYPTRAKEAGQSAIVAGENYGQGSSREHAALAPLQLGVEMVIAKNFARIHKNNLINFGILPLRFEAESDYEMIDQNDVLSVENVPQSIEDGSVTVKNETKEFEFETSLTMSDRQKKYLLEGGKLPYVKNKTNGQ